MSTRKLSLETAKEVFGKLAADYEIFAPTRQTGAGRFSNTDLLAYNQVYELSDVDFTHKTAFSAKSVVFPIREDMFVFEGERVVEAAHEDARPIIVFLRSCDIHAMKILDAVFLEHGGCADPFYERRHRLLHYFLIECAASFENCFCVSMGTNRTDAYAVFIRPETDGYAIQTRDPAFDCYFAQGEESDMSPSFVETNPAVMTVPSALDEAVFSDALWQEYSRRCIGCGRCNVSCPTCSCFTVQDIPDGNEKQRTVRRRIWSSCQVKHFSLLAGNRDFRAPLGDRMRYKVLHKTLHFKARHGVHMCVGCGRCNDVCPEYISLPRCVDKLRAVQARQEGMEAA